MNTAQASFAALAAIFVITGAVLLDLGQPHAGWFLIIMSSLAYFALGWMIISSALSRNNRSSGRD